MIRLKFDDPRRWGGAPASPVPVDWGGWMVVVVSVVLPLSSPLPLPLPPPLPPLSHGQSVPVELGAPVVVVAVPVEVEAPDVVVAVPVVVV